MLVEIHFRNRRLAVTPYVAGLLDLRMAGRGGRRPNPTEKGRDRVRNVIRELQAERKRLTTELRRVDAMLTRAGAGGERKTKRRRARVAKGIKPPTATPAPAKATTPPARPPVKALRAALKANIKKATTPTPANGKSKSGDLFSDD